MDEIKQKRTARRAAVAAFAVAFGLVAYTCVADRSAPAGQAPIAELTSPAFDQFKEEFNRAAGQVRLVVLLSPT